MDQQSELGRLRRAGRRALGQSNPTPLAGRKPVPLQSPAGALWSRQFIR